jgi:hypothetical protein
MCFTSFIFPSGFEHISHSTGALSSLIDICIVVSSMNLAFSNLPSVRRRIDLRNSDSIYSSFSGRFHSIAMMSFCIWTMVFSPEIPNPGNTAPRVIYYPHLLSINVSTHLKALRLVSILIQWHPLPYPAGTCSAVMYGVQECAILPLHYRAPANLQ